MNIPLEAPPDQSDLVRKPGDAIDDAAQRDLFESARQTEAVAPLPAANVLSVATPDAAGGEYLAGHEVIRRDAPSCDNDPHDETASGDEIVAEDLCDCETDTAKAPDELSKSILRRLETTLSELHNRSDAHPLPRAAQLPPISALPMTKPIDRIPPVRTQQRPPTRPIWLQEQQTQPPAPPPAEKGVLWPRAAKFLIACAIAAPVSYYLAVTTSPSKHSVEDTKLAPVVAESLAPRAPEQRDGMRADMAGPKTAPAQQRAIATKEFVKTPAFPGAPAPETAKQSSPETPPAEQASVPTTTTANLQDVKLLIDRGSQFFEAGDLIAARILLLRAVIAGDAEAAVALGATYDPVAFADRGVRGDVADLDKARSWYERAKEMGSPEGPRRLEMLANR
jgi:hypothetical protein